MRASDVPPLPWSKDPMPTGEAARLLRVPLLVIEIFAVIFEIPRIQIGQVKALDQDGQAQLRRCYCQYLEKKAALRKTAPRAVAPVS